LTGAYKPRSTDDPSHHPAAVPDRAGD
jgi:hypothetical protein